MTFTIYNSNPWNTQVANSAACSPFSYREINLLVFYFLSTLQWNPNGKLHCFRIVAKWLFVASHSSNTQVTNCATHSPSPSDKLIPMYFKLSWHCNGIYIGNCTASGSMLDSILLLHNKFECFLNNPKLQRTRGVRNTTH